MERARRGWQRAMDSPVLKVAHPKTRSLISEQSLRIFQLYQPRLLSHAKSLIWLHTTVPSFSATARLISHRSKHTKSTLDSSSISCHELAEPSKPLTSTHFTQFTTSVAFLENDSAGCRSPLRRCCAFERRYGQFGFTGFLPRPTLTASPLTSQSWVHRRGRD